MHVILRTSSFPAFGRHGLGASYTLRCADYSCAAKAFFERITSPRTASHNQVPAAMRFLVEM